jgi:autotransporter adhesin
MQGKPTHITDGQIIRSLVTLLATAFLSAPSFAQSAQCPDPRAPRFEGELEGRVIECRGAAGFSSQTNAFYTGYVDGKPGLILNVAPGSTAPGSTDAVNGGQLNAVSNSVSSLGFDLARIDRIHRAGEARNAALASIPQAMTPGAGMIGAGVGGSAGATAFAVGASKAFNQHTIAKAAVSVATRTSNVTWNVGAGYQF